MNATHDCEFRVNLDRAVHPSAVGRVLGRVLKKMTNADGASVPASRLALARSSGFSVHASNCAFSYGVNADNNIGSLIAEGPMSELNLLSEALEAFFRSDLRYRLSNGSTANWAQNFWQNVESLQTYEFRGRSTVGLPLVDNGLPYPLNRKVVDISRNPARRVFRQGYVEQVGPRMWFGADFPLSLDVASLQRLDCVDVSEDDEVLTVTVRGVGPFDPLDDVTLSDLRRAIYPTER